MTSISPHTTRAPGTILTATIYNFDHGNHIANAQALNAGKIEGAGSVVDSTVVLFDGVSGSAVKASGITFPLATAQLADDSVTYAKLQNVSASRRALGRISSGAGNAEELTFQQIATLKIRFANINGTGLTIAESDRATAIHVFDSNNDTITFPDSANITEDFHCIIANTSSSTIVLARTGTDTLDGLTTWTIYPGGVVLFQRGSGFWDSLLLAPMRAVFTANGSLVKPGSRNVKFADIEGWAGGAAGARGGAGNGGAGGGGGGYKWLRLPVSALGATETVTIGATVAGHTTGTTGAGTNGNNTTLGSLFTAYAGGGGGFSGTRGGGGGGGGSTQAGAQGTSTGGNGGGNNSGTGGGDNNNGTGADFGGSGGGGAGSGSNAGNGGNTNWGGAGGGGGSDGAGNGGNGGNSERGGAGGGGASDTGSAGAAGTSLNGGNGGAGATGAADAGDGVAPGGGGGGSESGTSGDGARGEMRVIFW